MSQSLLFFSQAITSLVKGFPAAMAQFLQQILPPVWATLTQSAEVYVKTVINNTEEADDPVDSDGEGTTKQKIGLGGLKCRRFPSPPSFATLVSCIFYLAGEVLGFENLVYSVFEFIHILIDINKFRGTIRKSMTDLLYYVVLYMQMTEDQVMDQYLF